jgi:hypothetical protein
MTTRLPLSQSPPMPPRPSLPPIVGRTDRRRRSSSPPSCPPADGRRRGLPSPSSFSSVLADPRDQLPRDQA